MFVHSCAHNEHLKAYCITHHNLCIHGDGRAECCNRYGEAGLKGGMGGMGGQGGEAYGSPFDIFEQFFGGQGTATQLWLGLHFYMFCKGMRVQIVAAMCYRLGCKGVHERQCHQCLSARNAQLVCTQGQHAC